MTRFRRLLLAMALAISATLFVPPAGPASANGGEKLCFPVSADDGTIIDWICVPLLIPVFIDKPDPCPDCPITIDFDDHRILPVELQREYLSALAESLTLVDQAVHAEDPALVYDLRERAIDTFGTAASILAGQQVALADVGVADLDRNVVEPFGPEPLIGAGNDLAEGLGYVSRQLSEPFQEPWRQVALRQLDQAYWHLSQETLGGLMVVICFWVGGRFVCTSVEPPQVEDPPICPICGWTFDFRDGLPDDLRLSYLRALGQSLALIDQAAHDPDPDRAYRVRQQAVDTFGEAARVLDGQPVEIGEVGLGHLWDNAFEPAQEPWLNEAGGALAEGLTYVSQQLAGPSPEPWRDFALQQLDQAYQSLTEGHLG